MKVKFTEEKCLNYDFWDFRMIGFNRSNRILKSVHPMNPNSDNKNEVTI